LNISTIGTYISPRGQEGGEWKVVEPKKRKKRKKKRRQVKA
jgi:hypothetical protein